MKKHLPRQKTWISLSVRVKNSFIPITLKLEVIAYFCFDPPPIIWPLRMSQNLNELYTTKNEEVVVYFSVITWHLYATSNNLDGTQQWFGGGEWGCWNWVPRTAKNLISGCVKTGLTSLFFVVQSSFKFWEMRNGNIMGGESKQKWAKTSGFKVIGKKLIFIRPDRAIHVFCGGRCFFMPPDQKFWLS